MHDWIAADALDDARALRDRLAESEDVRVLVAAAPDRAPWIRGTWRTAGAAGAVGVLVGLSGLLEIPLSVLRHEEQGWGRWVSMVSAACLLAALGAAGVAVVRSLSRVRSGVFLVVERENGRPFFFRPGGSWVRVEDARRRRRWVRITSDEFRRSPPCTVAVMHRFAGEVVLWEALGSLDPATAPDPSLTAAARRSLLPP